MAKAFARITRIGDSKGRSNYISNPKRQENIVLHSTEHMLNSWSDYSEYEQANKKNDKDNLEAREIVLHLPRDLDVYPEELKDILDKYCLKTFGNNRDFEYAVHWNTAETNLHAHILFSDRERVTEREPKIYKKDFWYDKETNRLAKANAPGAELRYKAGQVQVDKNTGEIKYNNDPFTKKDRYFKSQDFNEEIKKNQVEILNEHGYEFRMHDPKIEVAQEHVGNLYQRDEITQIKIHARNRQVREMNKFLFSNQMTVKEYLNNYIDYFNHNDYDRAEIIAAQNLVDKIQVELSDLEKKLDDLNNQEQKIIEKLLPYHQAKDSVPRLERQKTFISKEKIGLFQFNAQSDRKDRIREVNNKITKSKAIISRDTPLFNDLKPKLDKLREFQDIVGKQIYSILKRLENALQRLEALVPKEKYNLINRSDELVNIKVPKQNISQSL